MNIVFLGYMVPLEKMNQYSGISVAGNKMQYNIVSELNKLPDVTVYSVSILPYACFPREKRILVKGSQYEYNGIQCNEIGCWNLPIIKQITQIHAMYKQAKKIVKKLKNNKDDVCIMGFNLFPQVGIPMKRLRKYAETLIILADLPIDDNTNRKGFSRLLRRIFDSNTNKNIAKFDNFVVLSKCVKQDILAEKNVVVIEGGVGESDIIEEEKTSTNDDDIVIVYSGALTEYNGIINLIESMRYVESKNVELRIYGSGYLQEYVINSQKYDTRIKYCGQISNDEMRRCQREADILINPRQVNNQISRYTFPSKTFEYFLSRTLVVSTHIPSYPEEYLDKMIIAEDSPVGIAKAIKKVLCMSRDEKSQLEKKAYLFVINEKKWSVQVKKIYKHMENILNE